MWLCMNKTRSTNRKDWFIEQKTNMHGKMIIEIMIMIMVMVMVSATKGRGNQGKETSTIFKEQEEEKSRSTNRRCWTLK